MSGNIISFICWIVGKSRGPEGRSLIGGTLLRGLSTVIIYQLVEKYFNTENSYALAHLSLNQKDVNQALKDDVQSQTSNSLSKNEK